MITFTSDFGSRYAAAVRGVLLAATDAQVVDVSHTLPRWSTVEAAFWVDQLLRWYPPGVHLIAADPARAASTATVVGVVGEHRLLGPDTGICWPIAETLRDRTGEPLSWYLHTSEPVAFPTRDVRAPLAAALLSAPAATLEDCEAIDTPTQLRVPEGRVTHAGASGEVLTTDRFGNLITSVPATFVDATVGSTVRVADATAAVLGPHSAPPRGALVVTAGEHDRVEVVLGGASAADRLGLGPGDQLQIEVV